mmetsp:Transcript_25912/g.103595  ORF Transcript_25912/g.103595 Transcript_25912/m.103595 type:complete len:638 (-) Transcript_25912:69-1982(-)
MRGRLRRGGQGLHRKLRRRRPREGARARNSRRAAWPMARHQNGGDDLRLPDAPIVPRRRLHEDRRSMLRRAPRRALRRVHERLRLRSRSESLRQVSRDPNDAVSGGERLDRRDPHRRVDVRVASALRQVAPPDGGHPGCEGIRACGVLDGLAVDDVRRHGGDLRRRRGRRRARRRGHHRRRRSTGGHGEDRHCRDVGAPQEGDPQVDPDEAQNRRGGLADRAVDGVRPAASPVPARVRRGPRRDELFGHRPPRRRGLRLPRRLELHVAHGRRDDRAVRRHGAHRGRVPRDPLAPRDDRDRRRPARGLLERRVRHPAARVRHSAERLDGRHHLLLVPQVRPRRRRRRPQGHGLRAVDRLPRTTPQALARLRGVHDPRLAGRHAARHRRAAVAQSSAPQPAAVGARRRADPPPTHVGQGARGLPERAAQLRDRARAGRQDRDSRRRRLDRGARLRLRGVRAAELHVPRLRDRAPALPVVRASRLLPGQHAASLRRAPRHHALLRRLQQRASLHRGRRRQGQLGRPGPAGAHLLRRARRLHVGRVGPEARRLLERRLRRRPHRRLLRELHRRHLRHSPRRLRACESPRSLREGAERALRAAAISTERGPSGDLDARQCETDPPASRLDEWRAAGVAEVRW